MAQHHGNFSALRPSEPWPCPPTQVQTSLGGMGGEGETLPLVIYLSLEAVAVPFTCYSYIILHSLYILLRSPHYSNSKIVILDINLSPLKLLCGFTLLIQSRLIHQTSPNTHWAMDPYFKKKKKKISKIWIKNTEHSIHSDSSKSTLKYTDLHHSLNVLCVLFLPKCNVSP